MEEHHPSHEPQGTDHQEEEQQQVAREAPETHEPRPSQAAAEPQPQPAAAESRPSQPAAEPQPQPAAAEPQQSQAAAEAQPQEAAAEPRQSQAAAEPRSEQAGAEQAAETHRQEPEQPERPVQPEEPPAGADEQAPPEKRAFAEILAEFEQGKSAAERAGAPETAGAAAGATAGTSAASGVPATPNVGQKISGKILSITGDQVFVDLGTKSEGMIEAAQLRNAEGQLTVKVGDSLDAIVTAIDPESGVVVLRKKASGGRGGHQEVATELRQAFQYGMPVEGLVTGINKGGAEVQVYGMRAFCPLSQLDLRYVENPQQFIGQRLKFKVSRIEEGGRNRRPDIVLSRRALLEEEAQAKAAELRARLQIGAVLKGRITSLTTYGAFVDLGGLEGLLHVSEIGYSRLADPREALSVGQEIEVQVIKIEKGKDEKRPERISLSRRALERDPWRDAADRFPEGAVVPGRVMRLESFGAFVELAPGLEGLVHVSELGAGRRLNHAREAAQIGQDVKVRVLNVDPVKRRISLSMAQAGTGDDHEPAEQAPSREARPPREARETRDSRDSREPREPREPREAREPREPTAAGQQQPASFGSLGDFFKSSGQRRK
jgi:small subunit ribosomal protein S1